MRGGQPSNLSTKPLLSSPATPSHDKMCLCLPNFHSLDLWSPRPASPLCLHITCRFVLQLFGRVGEEPKRRGRVGKGITVVGVSGQIPAVAPREDRDTRLSVGSPSQHPHPSITAVRSQGEFSKYQHRKTYLVQKHHEVK